ncbi:MAG: chemotaxis protein CheX [Hungateiclostridium thermocellum]|nr:chemotaxis protein CheX [Acetivibrio thermocellus]
MAGDHLYAPFVESVKKVLKEKADIEICEEKFYTENKDVQSLGIACVVNFFGRIKGKFLIDMERDLAFALAKNIKGEYFDPEDEPMVLKPFQTLSKIIVNKAIEELNNLYSAKIEAAPPIVLKGKDALITVPKVEPVFVDCTTAFGKLRINVAIEEENLTGESYSKVFTDK